MAYSLNFGNISAKPRTVTRGEVIIGNLSDSSAVNLPLMIARGNMEGPVVWLGSAIHGIELGGSEVIRRVIREELDVNKLKGAVIGAPIMNPLAFRAADRCTNYDRGDMNRFFCEGEPSLTRTLAQNLYKLIENADYVVDYHSCNPPSLDFTIVKSTGDKTVVEASLNLAKAYGVTVTSPFSDGVGTLTGRASDDGKPSVCIELVFSRRIDKLSVETGVIGTMNILKYLGMVEGEIQEQKDAKVLEGEYWYKAVYAQQGGIVSLLKNIGDPVEENEVFAIIRNPFGDIIEEVKSPKKGWVIAYPMQGNQALAVGDKLAYIAWKKV